MTFETKFNISLFVFIVFAFAMADCRAVKDFKGFNPSTHSETKP